MALMIWLIAGFISACGALVMLELGTSMPRSGGMKVYLEKAFSPRLLVTCVYLFYCVFLRESPVPSCGRRQILILQRGLCKQCNYSIFISPKSRRASYNYVAITWIGHRCLYFLGGYTHSMA